MESRVKVWSNEIEMLFLEHYHSENILWDAKHLNHKDKKKHHDAWTRISNEMDIEIKELKKKKDSLLSSYRLYRKKVRDSSRSGAGAGEIYKPVCFAYAYMDSFLGEGLEVRKTTDTINQENNVQDFQENNQETENIDHVPSSDENPTTTKRRRKNPPELQQAEGFIKESLANLNQTLRRNNPQEKEDDCDRYGKMFANKLRQLPEDERLIFMHQIDGMFIQRRLSLNQNRLSSPIFASSPSPSPNILQSHQQNTSRPGSSFTSYSEPISLHRTYYDSNHDSKMAQSESIINKPSPNILQSHQQNTSRPGSSFTSYSEPISLHRTYYDSNHDSKMAQSESIINKRTDITQYPVLHLPEQSNANTNRIRILSNEVVSPPHPTQTESISQSQYEYNLIANAYESA